jgi:hypothetical protein
LIGGRREGVADPPVLIVPSFQTTSSITLRPSQR